MTDPRDIDAARARRAARRPQLEKRARIVQAIRAHFIGAGYLEVETPLLIPAPAPELHIEAIAAGGRFLHTSPELAMKRLLAAGYERIFQLGKVFRDGERGGRHLPEFTMLEFYAAGMDLGGLIDETQAMLRHIAAAPGVAGLATGGGAAVDLRAPPEVLPLAEAFARYARCSLDEAMGTGRFEEILTAEVEPHLGRARPTYIVDYPSSMASLARRKPEDQTLAERVELYVDGVELANGFGELTDPVEQRTRFEQERAQRARAGMAKYPMPEPFLRDLAHMPPAAGIAIGVDRLVMLFCGVAHIDEVVAFAPEEA